MKKSVLLIVVFLSSFWVSGQSIFELYADNDDVTIVSISPKMFKMLGQMSLSSDDPESQEYLEMITSINNLKVMVSTKQEIRNEMLNWVNQQVLNEDLEELMIIKDQEADVTFYAKGGVKEAYVEKLFMYVIERVHSKSEKSHLNLNKKEIKAVLMFLEGNIDLNKISKLTDQMNLPGGNQLRKAKRIQ